MKKTEAIPEVLIIGAGMAGLTLAARLAQAGRDVTIVDRESPEVMASDAFDSRTVALSSGTRAILDPLRVWDDLAPFAQAITAIDVQEGHDPFLLNFGAENTAHGAFGWILPNPVVRRTLYESCQRHGVRFVQDGLKDIAHGSDRVTAHLRSGTVIAARLLVGADGRISRVRALCGIDTVDLDYRQNALVGLVTHDLPHHGLAVERFYPDGPFAILPFTDDENGRHRSAIVWTRHRRKPSAAVPTLDEISAAIAPFFDARYGSVNATGRWAAYPLTLHHAKEMIAPRIALISDAAHAIHPIAGQGLNLGMRDVAALAGLAAGADDPGNPALLADYQLARRADVFAMVAATDLLNRLFGNRLAPLRWLRSAGLGVVDRLPPLKRFFAAVAMGQK